MTTDEALDVAERLASLGLVLVALWLMLPTTMREQARAELAGIGRPWRAERTRQRQRRQVAAELAFETFLVTEAMATYNRGRDPRALGRDLDVARAT